ncbi:MAG: transcriptional regulator [Desulfobulbaceae bacterium]|nr:MAG: transcriptional regulator [Desulfobulbaceae bacterium]
MNSPIAIEETISVDNLKRLADAVVGFFGPSCEVCLHDVRSLQRSLVYITGDVTCRKPGAPATDLLVRALQQQRVEDLHNYRTITGNGRALKSSTVFIRDAAGKPLFAFCINFDTTNFFNASQALQPFVNSLEQSVETSETFALVAEETIESLVNRSILALGKQPATMTTEEKTRLIGLLQQDGVFRLKGAVEQVARLVGVSRYTVYNYLRKIRTP